MKRKDKKIAALKAKITGFRDFMITAEKDKLEKLVEKDPSYFYNILPYAYVLNVSKKWVEKFEHIPYPKIDTGDYDYNDLNTYDRMYDDIYRPESTSSSFSSHSSGSSSCGGGCSSCGGGCSSCGGGGSW